MKLYLAPMEGVVDDTMRALMSSIGGIDVCVTEFIRITDQLYPERVFYKRCPELLNNSQTPSGTPVRVQLLGGKADPIAQNAQKVAQLGASAIDLNFGCPAKTVNRNDGGACLLKEPHRLYDIVHATRQAVPAATPVTAKMRLGFDERSGFIENAQAIYEAGASELTVHARSKADGYKPPAYWEYIAQIREAIPITVIANGDIWSVEDFKRCRDISGCDHFMLGRGLLSRPDLALQIKALASGEEHQEFGWLTLCDHLTNFFDDSLVDCPNKHIGNRVKQWLFYLSRNYLLAQQLFESIKKTRDATEISQSLHAARQWV